MLQLIFNTAVGLIFMVIVAVVIYLCVKGVIALIGLETTWFILVGVLLLPVYHAIGSLLLEGIDEEN